MAWADQSKELYFEHGVSEVAGGPRRRRTWRVAGVVPDVARVLGGRPQRGDVESFPGTGPLVLDSIDFRPDGAGTLVQAVYAPAEYGTLDPPENTTDLEWIGADGTFEDVDVEIPLFQVRVVTGFNNGTPFVLTTYQAIDRKVPFRYSRMVHRITLNATIMSAPGADTALAITQAIAPQVNKVHQINGRKMVFKPDGTRRIAQDKYELSYRWIEDRGIDNTLEFDDVVSPGTGSTPGAFLGRIGSNLYACANTTHVIPPYKRIETAPLDPEDPTTPPVVKVMDTYDEDLTGWQTLPGIV